MYPDYENMILMRQEDIELYEDGCLDDEDLLDFQYPDYDDVDFYDIEIIPEDE